VKHDEARMLLAPWALDLLDPEIREPVGDHIEVCGVCQMEAALYAEAVSGLFAYAARRPDALAVGTLPAFDAARLEALKLNVRRALAQKDGLLPGMPQAAPEALPHAARATGDRSPAAAHHAPPESPGRDRKGWRFRGRHIPPPMAPPPSPPASGEDDFGTDILDLAALVRRPSERLQPPLNAPATEAGGPETGSPPDERPPRVPGSPAAHEPLPRPAEDEQWAPAEPPVPVVEAAGAGQRAPGRTAPQSPPATTVPDSLESLLDLVAPRETPPRPAPPPAPEADAPAAGGASPGAGAAASKPAPAPELAPLAAASVAAATPARQRLPQPWEVFEDEQFPDEDDAFSTEAALDDLFGGPARGAAARAGVAGAPRVPAETTYIDEYGDPYILRKGVNSGWRSAAILLGLLSVGLFAALVAGFFVLLDTRNRADLLEQKQPRLALYFGFSNDEVQGTVYLQPPSYTRGLIAMDTLVNFPREKQLVLWAEGPDGVVLIRPLFRQVGSSRTYVDLTRVPRGFTRMFITEEDSPFRGQVPTGREVMTVRPPFDP
jgi:hypothetical protein